jgi:hypothetical protein
MSCDQGPERVTGPSPDEAPLADLRLIVDRPAPSGGQLSSLTIEPDQVVGGDPALGTVTLGGPVDVNTEVTLISTDPSGATVPSSVTVPAGQTGATFTITTLPNNTDVGQW